VAEVCRRLDGIPLAIELAAARTRLLTPAQIAERLEETLALPAGPHGGAERHYTMRAALAWSYDMLSEAEQGLFRRLAVFRSSFILEAAAAVAPAVGGDILSLLGGLIDKSLVAVVDGPAGERRFRLLGPVRQFAADLLDASGERDDAARCHRDHLQSRLRAYGDFANFAPGTAAFERLAAEVDNLRAVVEHAMRASQPEAAVALIQSYRGWWPALGLVDEQQDRLEAALTAADPGQISLGVLANALSMASRHATYLGRVDAAAAFAGQLGELQDQHPENFAVRGAWAHALATLTFYRADGDRLEGNRLILASQHAYEACGLPGLAAAAALNVPLAAILWDFPDDPYAAASVSDTSRLGQTGGAPNVAAFARLFDRVIRVMAGAGDAYPSCLEAFAVLDALDGGWLAAWGGLSTSVAAELVGDQTVATAHALRWVRFCRRSGVRLMLSCGIRAAARLSAMAGDPDESLRLWAGAEHVEVVTGMRYMPLMERLDRPLRQECTDALGPDAARLLAEGASWSVAEATQAAEEALLRLQADNDWNETKGAAV
jgi:hypothetical protein